MNKDSEEIKNKLSELMSRLSVLSTSLDDTNKEINLIKDKLKNYPQPNKIIKWRVYRKYKNACVSGIKYYSQIYDEALKEYKAIDKEVELLEIDEENLLSKKQLKLKRHRK
ncbi:MAG: hypothetical protein RSB41_04160 [Bacilli bacterium]